MEEKYMDEAVKVASRSPFKHKTGAVLLCHVKKASRVKGWAHHSTHPLRRTYSMHAEIHALLRYHVPYYIKQDSEIYIATISKGGNVVSARPCISCAIALYTNEIYTVHYTTSQGIETLDLMDELDPATFKEYPGLNGRNS